MSSEADDFKSAKALIKIEKLEPVDAECEQKNQRIEEGTILFGNLGSAFNKEIKSEREGLLPKSFGEIVLTVAKEETASLNCNGTRIKIEEESESEDSECVAEAEPHIFMEHTIIIDSKQNVKIEIEPSDDNFIVGSEGEDNVEERTEDAVNLHNMDGNLEADVQAGSSAVLPHLPVSKNELSSRNVGDTGSGIHMRLQCEDTILDGSDKRIMGSKKKRSFNFSEEEMTLLMDLVVKKKNIIECKISNADLWKKKEMASDSQSSCNQDIYSETIGDRPETPLGPSISPIPGLSREIKMSQGPDFIPTPEQSRETYKQHASTNKRTRKHYLETEEDSGLREAVKALKNIYELQANDSHDEVTVFGRSVAAQLRKLPEEHQIKCIGDIQEVITGARLNYLKQTTLSLWK